MEFKDLNEVIDFAIEKEVEAADFYRDAAKQESFSGAAQMLEEFAKEEDKHAKLLQNVKNSTADQSISSYKFKWIPDMKRSDYMSDVDYTPGMGYRDLLLLAIKREEKALKLYQGMREKAEGEDAVKVFNILCQEEANHKLKLESMYDDYMAEMGD
ncbi:MAG: ferritin family protein [Desulfococcaceae bacterium]|jgi:rubrerythrin|nr:ferritin family protein [Desulfococcaceae bacterium]